jgi:hypothetical protein
LLVINAACASESRYAPQMRPAAGAVLVCVIVLATGTGYSDVGHLYGLGAHLGPRAYPPLFPLVIAPIYWARGVDFLAFKLVGVACVAGGLLMGALLARRQLGPWLTATFVLLVGLHPVTRELVDHVLSEPLFFFWLAGIALAVDTWAGRAATSREQRRRGAVIGLLIGAAALTRGIGLVFGLDPIPWTV